MSDIKIICCDIDGTLLRDDKSLSEENRLWISKAVKERGVKFVIVSGRMLSALKHYNNVLGISGLTSCLNGTFLVDENDKVLASHIIDFEKAQKIVDIKDRNNLDMLCISGNTWYTEKHEGYLYEKKIPIYMQESVIANPRELIQTTPINKFLFMSPNKAELDDLQQQFNEVFAPGELSYYGGSNFFEVMIGGITKGTAVDDLISYYKVDRSQIMALGDDVNDIDMLQKAGIGVAMGNALDCAKEVADYVTDTNENDGVAKAIQKFVFN